MKQKERFDEKPKQEHTEPILNLFHVRTGREIVRNDLICIHIQNRRNIAFAPRQIEL